MVVATALPHKDNRSRMSSMTKPSLEPPPQSIAASAGATDLDATLSPALTSAQWRSGIAAWLGWLFDGLDMHIYTIVAAPFVAELIGAASANDPAVKVRSGWIQAAFLVGWALGGGIFGRLGDRLGRSRALALTIGTYALFTGLSAFAMGWWQLLAFRFLAALGIGGEWAVGSSLLSETWPARWRAWVAAGLQTAVNIGVLIACGVTWILAGHHRVVFLVGVLPALLVFWIRRKVPETEEWQTAKDAARSARATDASPVQASAAPHVARVPVSTAAAFDTRAAPLVACEPCEWADLFRPPVRRITLLTMIVCACSLTAWWGFLFWNQQQLRNLPDLKSWSPDARDRLVSMSFFLVIGVSIVGNFFAAAMARVIGYRRSIAVMCLGFFVTMFGTYCVQRDHVSLLLWTPWVGFFSGVFALFTMYLPPLFPTLLRTTGAGFSYNIGRIAAAAGTVIFGMFATVSNDGDFRKPLMYGSFLFLPAMAVALMMPDLKDPATIRPSH